MLSRRKNLRTIPPEQEAANMVYAAIAELAQLARSPDLPQGSIRRRARHLLEVVASTTHGQDGVLSSPFEAATWAELKELCGSGSTFFAVHKQPKRVVDTMELHVGGEQSVRAILGHISAAKTSVRIWMYVWCDDHTGNEVAAALLAAAERGVRITIYKDQCGVLFERGEGKGQSFFHKGFVRLRDALGSRVVRWMYSAARYSKQCENVLAEKLLDHANITIERRVRRDHSKVFIIDEQTIILGGVNISDSARHAFHDYMVELQSRLLVGRFLARLEGKPNHDLPLGASVEFFFNVVNRLRGRKREVSIVMRKLLEGAQREVIIQMAYFGDKRITDAIVTAAQRGVQIAILASERANLQTDLNYKVLREILRRTPAHSVRVYLTRTSHAKVILVDRCRTFLGSANMNTTGTVKLGESNIYVNDSDGSGGIAQSPFTRTLHAQLLADMQSSKRIVSPHQLKMKKMKAWLESRFLG